MSDSVQPEVTESLRAEAKQNPGQWIYSLDPEADSNGEVPPHAIAGAWKVSDAGIIESAFTANPSYVPSPTALGWRPAESDLERAIQMWSAGLLEDHFLDVAFAATTVWVYAQNDADDALFVSTVDSGQRAVYAFSDEKLLRESGWEFAHATNGRELADATSDDVVIVLNAGQEASAVLTPGDILSARQA